MVDRGAIQRLFGILALIGLLLTSFSYLNALSLTSVLPVSLSLMGSVLVLLALLPALVRDHRLPGTCLLVGALWVSFALAVPYSARSTYGALKVQELFTIALLAVVGGIVLLRTPRAREIWLLLIVVLGVVVSVAANFFPSQIAEDQTGRLAVEGGSAISTGRAAGAAAVVLISLVMGGIKRRRWVGVGLAVVLLLIVVASGSRGPLIAAGIASLAVALVPVRKRIAKFGLLVAVAALSYYLAAHSSYSTDRFAELGVSGENRIQFWRSSWALARDHPLGLGWGGLEPYLEITYPHNIVLEVLAEAGWMAGVLLVATLITAMVLQARAARNGPVEMAMLGLLVFMVVNAMVSSDVAGNRGLWSMVGAAMAASLSSGPQLWSMNSTRLEQVSPVLKSRP